MFFCEHHESIMSEKMCVTLRIRKMLGLGSTKCKSTFGCYKEPTENEIFAFLKEHPKAKRNLISIRYKRYKRAALNSNRAFAITREFFELLVTCPCHYCGAEPSPLNGVDRVLNDHGYYVSNVVPCCKHCNFAKRDRTKKDFISWAIRLAEHQKGGQL